MPVPHLHLRPDASLSLKDPEATVIGRSMLLDGLELMDELGLEAFTFKKLADRIGCTEVSLYKYFPNKQRLLQYYFQLYWLWLRLVCGRHAELAKDPREGLERVIGTVCGVWPKDLHFDHW